MDQAFETAVLRAMEAYFGGDARRIEHAHRVTAWARELLRREGGDPMVIIGAAALHDIGIHEAEHKYGSTSGKYQEIEGPPIARRILTGLDIAPDTIEEICRIIAFHHSIGPMRDNLNFRVLYDADWLVNLGDEFDPKDTERLRRMIERVFLTETGRRLAAETYLGRSTAG